MKNLLRTILTLLLTVGFIFPGCEKDSCDGVVFQTYFDIQGIRLFHFEKYEFYAEGRTVGLGDTISFEELDKVYIDFTVDYVVNSAIDRNWSLSLIPMAYSCTYIPGENGSKDEELVSFSIITLNDFDGDHLANSNINDLFDYYGHYSDFIDTPIPLSQFISQQSGTIKHEDMVLDLTIAPEMEGEFQVKVIMELSNGDYFEFDSDPIYISL